MEVKKHQRLSLKERVIIQTLFEEKNTKTDLKKMAEITLTEFTRK